MGMSLGMAGVSGILGNELMRERITGYFPRRHQLILQTWVPTTTTAAGLNTTG